ncbi:MAG: flagellin, partial [Veillonellaceae bacterium]|nr:flagellin [Veillonellaceae bacterium]
MIINHNMASLNTYRQLSANNAQTSKSLEKLSSGLRINRAGDDAAGLAISEKMRGQIRGLDQASRNAQDGISLIQTAEGSLNETHSILQRMRELAVQGSNDTATDSDRNEIQKEIEQLKSEINRISDTTEFNTKKLLDGSIGQTSTITGTNAARVTSMTPVDSTIEGDYTVTFSNQKAEVAKFQAASGVQEANVTIENTDAAGGLKAGSYTLEFTGDNDNATVTLKDVNGETVATASAQDFTGGDITLTDGTNDLITIAQDSYNGTSGKVKFDVEITADVSIANADGSTTTKSGVKADANSVMSVGGLEIGVTSFLQADDATVNVTNNGLNFHIGANQNQTTRLAVSKMDTTSLNVNDVDVTSQSGAEAGITKLDIAIQKVSAERSKLGAVQNRLEHTIANLGTSSENLTAAESRVRDVDMAKEMMNFQKNNILSQAAQAMLAQANQQPQGVL